MSNDNLVARVQENVHSVNPFNDSSSAAPRRNLALWRVLATLSYFLVVITSIYYTFALPEKGVYSRHTIWGQNNHRHTPFALNAAIVIVYWIIMYTLQFTYLIQLLFGPAAETVTSAAALAPYFTFHNLFAFAFIHLWCRSYFWQALLIVAVNFLQLTIGYFNHPNTPNSQHVAVLAMPLAFAFVALYWDGAAAVHARHFAARVVANVFIWSWPVYGGFYLVVFKDWAMGFSLSALAAALGVAQFLTVIFALQWIFAFTIMGILFLASVAVAIPGITGGEPFKRGAVVSAEQEREPLLGGENA